jgi:hypothetical protein
VQADQQLSRELARILRREGRLYSLPEVHKRSGSKLPPHKFRHAVEQIVADAKLDPLPDYDLILEQGERSAILRMRHRTRPARLTAGTPSRIPAS